MYPSLPGDNSIGETKHFETSVLFILSILDKKGLWRPNYFSIQNGGERKTIKNECER
jgi:hypothetical protein